MSRRETTLSALAAYRIMLDGWTTGVMDLETLNSIVEDMPDGYVNLVVGLGNIITFALSGCQLRTGVSAEEQLKFIAECIISIPEEES